MNTDFSPPDNPREELESRLTALLLGELPADEAAALRHAISQDAELAALCQRLQTAVELVRETAAHPAEPMTEPSAPLRMSDARREELLQSFKTVTPREFAPPRRRIQEWFVPVAAAAAIVIIAGSLLLPHLASKNPNYLTALEKAPARVTDGPITLNGRIDSPEGRELIARLERERVQEVKVPPPVVVKPSSGNIALPGGSSENRNALVVRKDGAQVFSDDFGVTHNYLTLGITNAIWDGTYDTQPGIAASDFPTDPSGRDAALRRPTTFSDATSQLALSANSTQFQDQLNVDRLTGISVSQPQIQLGPITLPAPDQLAKEPAAFALSSRAVTAAGETPPETRAMAQAAGSQHVTFRDGKPTAAGGGELDAVREGLRERAADNKSSVNSQRGGELASADDQSAMSETAARGGAGGGGGRAARGRAGGGGGGAGGGGGGARGGRRAGNAAQSLVGGVQPANASVQPALQARRGAGNTDAAASDSFANGATPVLGQVDDVTRKLIERHAAEMAANNSTPMNRQDLISSRDATLQNQLNTQASQSASLVAGQKWAGTPPPAVAQPTTAPGLTHEWTFDHAVTVAQNDPTVQMRLRDSDTAKAASTPAPTEAPAKGGQALLVHRYAFTDAAAPNQNGAAFAAGDTGIDGLTQANDKLRESVNKLGLTNLFGSPSPAFTTGGGVAGRGGLGGVGGASARTYPNATMPGPVLVTVDPETHELIVATDTGTRAELKELIDKIDSSRKQTSAASTSTGHVDTSVNLDWQGANSNALNYPYQNGGPVSVGALEAGGIGGSPANGIRFGNTTLYASNQIVLPQAQTATGHVVGTAYQQTPLAQTAPSGINAIAISNAFGLMPANAQPVLQTKLESDKPAAMPSAPAPIPQPDILTRENAFSTFSMNVSDVSFKLAQASLENGTMPPAASIRSEEFINAFDYRDPLPAPGAPLAFAWGRARDPFAHNRDLLRFSVKTAALGREAGKPLNLVLLLDTSGSMERADRVRIVHEALRVLASQLSAKDTLSVVTFARTARLWVDGLAGDKAGPVADQLSGITPQGGTNLEEAMRLAYQTAARHYKAVGINRVVLLTDGAANLGNVKPESLKKSVESNRKQGIVLDCYGVGWDDYNDTMLETLSRNADGRYGFLNSPESAATEFAAQLAGAMRVAAQDLKVQVEFNPARVTSWRQIGYARLQLTKQQFRDNTVAAAEIGAAEAGNAVYVTEVNPAGQGPVATVRVRYRDPGTSNYHEHEWTVPYDGAPVGLEKADEPIRLATVAAEFSEWLAGSPYAGEVTPDKLLTYLKGIPEDCGADDRASKLEWMIRQAKSITGK